MPNLGGNEPRRAILYARVSTEEQARHGYSLAGQLRTLREHAVRKGLEVLEEVADPGHSGATLERPGVDRIRDLVAEDRVDAVLAQNIDRISREPWHYEYLKAWLEDRGTVLQALDDDADGSAMGEFVSYIRRGVAKLERADTLRRTNKGRLDKAREGRVLAPRRPRYGFRPDPSGEGYEVDEEKMGMVRRVFGLVAGGASLSSVADTLDREGVPTPRGGRFWDRTFLRSCILDDVYRPHTADEVRVLVSSEVAAGLDPNRHYGVWWYNRRGLTRKRGAEPFGRGGDGKGYRWYDKPVEEHIAVPVPDSGIPRSLVDAAREVIKNNRAPSRAGDRFWELSGGVAVCAGCGRRMISRRKPKTKNGKRYEYDYYHCSGHHSHGRTACENSRNSAAGKLEGRIWDLVRDFLAHPTRLETGLNRLVEEERADALRNPGPEIERLTKRISAADRERANYHKMAAREMISFEELDERLSEVEESRRSAREELDGLNRSRQRLEELEKDRDTLLEHYKVVVPSRLYHLTPQQRHEIYKVLGTEALVSRGGSVEVRLKKVQMKAGRGGDSETNPRSVKTEGSSKSARTAAR